MHKKTNTVRLVCLILTLILCVSQAFSGNSILLFANTETVTDSTNLPSQTSHPTMTPSPTPQTSSGPGITPEITATPDIETTPDVSIPTQEPVVQPPVAEIRLMFTTDLHGNLTTTEYETGAYNSTGTLARCATLFNQARAEKPAGNTFQFDIGDQLYNYSTDYIFEQDSTSVQPIYSAMKSMGYDAITLGNHEFDYNLSYIQNQIANSGLQDICVVSNVKLTSTKKTVWKQNMMLTRTVTLTDGSTMDIKIGIIGETQPGLSGKRSKYSNTLTTEDIVANTQAEAKNLKAQGADLIVVLSHSGVGTAENPENMAPNVSYALTKIPEVDVVLCGHEHRYFPSSSPESAKYYKLSGIDAATGLANGKNLIMVANKGASIGIADLSITRGADNTIQILDRKSSIRNASADVPADEAVNNNFLGKWRSIFTATYSNILGEISDAESYNNYFAPVEDNSLIQLINNAKMTRALKVIQTNKTDYANYPVVAATSYVKCGSDDDKEYVSYTDYFLESYLSNLQIYKTGVFLYPISGAQLREWMEWSASAYNTTPPGHNASGSALSADGTQFNQTMFQSEWNSDPSNFYIFDGMEYTIDTSIEPRYNFAGTQINNTNRITSLTINGVPVKDNDTLIMATNNLSVSTNPFLVAISDQKIYGAQSIRWRTVIKEYLEAFSLNSTLNHVADDNWNVLTGANSTQILKSALTSEELAIKKNWIISKEGMDSDFIYYLVDLWKKNNNDTAGPNIVATALSDELSHSAVTVMVRANDRSGIAELKYAKGKYTEKADVWNDAEPIADRFDCKENGIYTIFAKDTLGNRRVSYIRILNINADTISAPIVNTFTNRKTEISGIAAPKSTVYIKTPSGKNYSTTATATGEFTCTVAPQDADSTLYVYAVDSNGRTSPRVTITVSRTGPNQPSLDTVKSNSKKVTGNICDTFAYPILYSKEKNIVYVPETDGKSLYKASAAYDEGCKIVEVPCTIATAGAFTITLPQYLPGNTGVTLYTLDSSARKSLSVNKTIAQKKPPKPALLTSFVSNATTKIKVSCGEKCNLYAKVGKKRYSHKTVSYDSSTYSYEYTIPIPKTNTGTKISVFASNSVGTSAAITARRKETVPNTPKITSVNLKKHTVKGSVHFINANHEKSTLSASKTKVYLKVNGKKYKAKIASNGNFTIKVPTLAKGQTYSIWAKNVNGVSVIQKKKVK